MAGIANETQVRAELVNVVDALESIRNFADGTMAGTSGKLDDIEQAVVGQYMPSGLVAATRNMRSGLSTLINPTAVLAALGPVLYEYGTILSADATLGYGGGFADLDSLFRAIYEWFIDASPDITVQSRDITYGTPSAAGGNTGDGTMTRLTEDEYGYDLEACTVEKKIWRCIGDQNTGQDKEAELFQVVGEQASQDSLLKSTFGSGVVASIFSKNAGSDSSRGGSLLTNSSFDEYTSGATQEFDGWTVTGGATIEQNTTTTYRGFPGSGTAASVQLNEDTKLVQTLDDMLISEFDEGTPYFLRVMFYRESNCDGTLTIRMGSQSANVSLSLQSGWTELALPADKNLFPRNFNEDSLTVEIELSSNTTGDLLIDDVLFCPFDEVDGTYWLIRNADATPTAWLLDDTITATDTGGAPATGKIQWWLYQTGRGWYLPSTTGTPTIADP